MNQYVGISGALRVGVYACCCWLLPRRSHRSTQPPHTTAHTFVDGTEHACGRTRRRLSAKQLRNRRQRLLVTAVPHQAGPQVVQYILHVELNVQRYGLLL